MAAAGLEQWDVCIVEWPHNDGSSKPRPAVLLSQGPQIKAGDLLFMKVSGQRHPVEGADLPLGWADGAEFTSTGLAKSSYLHPTNLERIPASQVYKVIGFLGPDAAELALAVMQRVRR